MKKLLSGILASSVLISSLTMTAMASTFSDVPSTYWANSYIQAASDANLVSGTGNGNFSPAGLMNYGAFAVIMTNGAFGGEKSALSTDTHWSDPYLNVLLAHNLFQSEGESVVSTETGWQDQGISRENVATVVARLAELSGISETPQITTVLKFTDFANLSIGQKQDIAVAVQLGIMAGTTDTEFGVGQTLDRASACVIIDKMLKAGLLTAKEAEASNNISISGKVLDFMDNYLYVEDTKGTLHTIYVESGVLDGVTYGGMVDVTYHSKGIVSYQQTSQGADVLGAYLNGFKLGWWGDSWGKIGFAGQTIYWDLTKVTNLSAAEKEIFLRYLATCYVDGVVHKLGTWNDLEAEAEATGETMVSDGNISSYRNLVYAGISTGEGASESYFTFGITQIGVYVWHATLNPTTGQYTLEAGVGAS